MSWARDTLKRGVSPRFSQLSRDPGWMPGAVPAGTASRAGGCKDPGSFNVERGSGRREEGGGRRVGPGAQAKVPAKRGPRCFKSDF